MQHSEIDFQQNVRRVYTAVKKIFRTHTRFSSIDYDDDHFVVEGRRGWLISPFTERVKMRVVATGTQSCKVVVESSSRSVLNLFNLGANKKNVTQLEDFISNEVYKLCSDEEIKLRPSEIKMRES